MKKIALILGLMLLSTTAHAAISEITVTSGTATMTVDHQDGVAVRESAQLYSLEIAWTTDSGGNAVLETDHDFHGMIMGYKSVPATGGTKPTDNYDILIEDEAGVDLIDNDTVDADAASKVSLVTDTTPPIPIVDQLTITITNAGNAKAGTLIIYVRQ